MRNLYQQYHVAWPLGYVTDLFDAWGMKDAKRQAIAFYAPMFLFYSIYDGTEDKAAASDALRKHMHLVLQEWSKIVAA